jgi:dephospho-CoA kinase
VGEDQRRAIEARQLSGEEKARRADLVVVNDAGLDKLRGQAEEIWKNVLDVRGSDYGTQKKEA